MRLLHRNRKSTCIKSFAVALLVLCKQNNLAICCWCLCWGQKIKSTLLGVTLPALKQYLYINFPPPNNWYLNAPSLQISDISTWILAWLYYTWCLHAAFALPTVTTRKSSWLFIWAGIIFLRRAWTRSQRIVQGLRTGAVWRTKEFKAEEEPGGLKAFRGKAWGKVRRPWVGFKKGVV